METKITEIAGKELKYSRDFSTNNVGFYKGLGFKPPYRLLIDWRMAGNLHKGDFKKLESVASHILKADVKIYISKCSVDAWALSQAKESKHCSSAVCAHTGDRIDQEECISRLVGEDNLFKFFIVTNQQRVHDHYANMRIGVPVMFHNSKGLRLMPPRRQVRELIEGQQGVEDQQALGKRKRNKLKKIRAMEAAKKGGDAPLEKGGMHKRRKEANRARKKQREQHEQEEA